MIDRTAVRNNANYLRNVRPIDPEEIAEYIEGTPHPAVVRETLREEAFDLRLREREDGAFVPVEETPVDPPRWEPESLPEAYAFAVEDLLVREYGANWHRGESGDALRERVRRLKTDYLYENEVEYDRVAALGYAIYHLPAYYATVGYVLDDLTENGLLDRTLRVLDVGAGVGGPALGLHDYLSEDAVVDYHAVEPSAATDVLDRMLEETGRNFRTTVHETTAEAFLGIDGDEKRDPATDDPFDLVCFGNVLSELADPVAVADAALDALAPDGSLVAFAPADRNTAVGLRRVERALVAGDDGDFPGNDAEIYSPALRLWPDAVPSDPGWSFDVEPDLEVPPFQRRLDEATTRGETDEPGEFVNVDVQFAYSILRKDGKRGVDVEASAERCARMAESERHVTDRVNVLAVKLSHDLSEGDNALYRVGDGSQATDHYLVCTRETALNRDLGEAGYGAVVFVENGLVLWNEDEGAYNVVVDDETVVDLVAP
ncbi:methyltransferase type 12 [Halorubrum californiense DSM 19288]|uniref:Methyltransferase type 12 n=1 Tax=Halorubrum californiense DSM 19288 TaxID=1227465 RepID=M0DZD8_9EURY|nr:MULTISPECIES: methyltransferase domain-containing protein [Halorubrum]ELZ40042.1 methyltransferase type 12 [Halorubrum californiense DSM 19288]TKX73236.1 class I SAM-dependent methyltransferase [Halorubrum sp. GN11GM_10-3_MGM]